METRPRIRRRAVLTAGSAWAVPTLVVASPARAAAVSASCSTPCPTFSFGGGINSNGWATTSKGSFDDSAYTRFDGSYTPWVGTDNRCTQATGGSLAGSLTNAVSVIANPTSLTPPPVVTYSTTVCLTSGYSYTFSFDWNYYGLNRRAATLTATLVGSDGLTAATATPVTAPSAVFGDQSANKRGTTTFSHAPTLSDNFKFVYSWTFGRTPGTFTDTPYNCNGQANDIGVTAPKLTKCTRV